MRFYPKKNKYKNNKVYNSAGKKLYDSGKEAKRGKQLELLEAAGEISQLQKQVKFKLLSTFQDNQGKTERGINYIADFVYIEGRYKVAEDVKGFKTPDYILKRKLFKVTYPEIIFKEV